MNGDILVRKSVIRRVLLCFIAVMTASGCLFAGVHAKLQYAGGMGLVSVGPGLNYGKKVLWDTDFMIGYLPSCYADADRAVFSLRQSCAPFDCPIGERSSFEPLLCGAYVTLVTGERFWTQEPSKYGGDYYRFSSRIRLHAFVGQRLNFLAGSVKICKLSLYYELGACDLNLISKFTNRKLRFSDIVSFSFGVRVQPDLSRLVKDRQ